MFTRYGYGWLCEDTYKQMSGHAHATAQFDAQDTRTYSKLSIGWTICAMALVWVLVGSGLALTVRAVVSVQPGKSSSMAGKGVPAQVTRQPMSSLHETHHPRLFVVIPSDHPGGKCDYRLPRRTSRSAIWTRFGGNEWVLPAALETTTLCLPPRILPYS